MKLEGSDPVWEATASMNDGLIGQNFVLLLKLKLYFGEGGVIIVFYQIGKLSA